MVTVDGEAPLIQAASGEKSFSIDPESAAALPLGNRSYIALLVLAPGVAVDQGALASQLTTGGAARPGRRRIGGGGDGNYMVDGVTTMDPGVNRPASRISVRSDLRSQGRHVRLPGGIRPVERPADQRRHQERHQPVPRRALRRRAQVELRNANSKTNILNGDPKPFGDERDWGWSIGGPVGQAGRQQQAVLLLQPGVQPAHGRQHRHPLPDADGARAAGRLFAVDRQPRQPVPVHQGSRASAGACNAANTRSALLRRRRRARQDPAEPLCIRPGLNILKWWPEPNIPHVPTRPGLQLREPRTRRRTCSAGSRSSAWTTSRSRTCAAASSSSDTSSRTTIIPGIIPGFNDTRAGRLRHLQLVGGRQLQPEQLDVPRGLLWRGTRTTRKAARSSAAIRTGASPAIR